ncbi:MAG: ACP phosphodiesterase [Weeksellaceae bacterium]
MNLVAHQLLSFNNPSWQIGNHLGEVVKVKHYLKYPEPIQKGILLHRLIDSYTDQHPIVKRSSTYLHKDYGKYSPVIVDIFYDFILIKNWDKFSEVPFKEFKNNCYHLLNENMPLYPPKLKLMTNALIKYDWFQAYGSYEGIEKTLRGLSVRTTFQNNMYKAVKDLYMKESDFEEDFLDFYPDLIHECKRFLEVTS